MQTGCSALFFGPSKQMGVSADELVITSLRRATRDRHVALEAILQLDSPFSPRRYLDVLRGFELFLSTWEPRINAALDLSLRHWFATRSRRRLLQQDLARLDGGRDEHEHASLVCNQAVFQIDVAGAAATFGSMYVLEGSALGGQVIARAARATLGLGPENGVAYFNGHERHTATRWAEFRVLLEEQVGPAPGACQQACEAAYQTFDALIATFTCLFRDDAVA